MTRNNPHTTKYWVDGHRQERNKICYATRDHALAAIDRLLVDEYARDHPLGYNAYRCPRCPWWHVGRAGRRRSYTPEDRARKQLYWAIWRYANGKPNTRHI